MPTESIIKMQLSLVKRGYTYLMLRTGVRCRFIWRDKADQVARFSLPRQQIMFKIVALRGGDLRGFAYHARIANTGQRLRCSNF